MRHTIVTVAILLALMFLLYTLPRLIWGFGLDLFPSLF